MSQQNPRSLARSRALQALYQWQMTGHSVSDVEAQFLAEEDMKGVDTGYFSALLHEVPGNISSLDAHVAPLLDRPIDQVDPVERAILRIAVCEFVMHPEIPYRVVINEAVELAKIFGAEQGHRFVNGVLDKVGKELRPAEAERRGRGR